MATITVTDLTATYGQARALSGIDLSVEHEEVVAVLGHNGAGKSTLLSSISRAHTATTGSVQIDGREVVGMRPNDVSLSGVSYVREGAPVFGQLGVEEHLRLGARLARSRGREPVALEEVYRWFPVLEERRRTSSGVLSGGQRQMLCLSMALVSRPDVLLLDEPSAGLAPTMAEAVFEAVRDLCRSGMAVLLAEQDMRWVDGFASRCYLLETGRLVGAQDLSAEPAHVVGGPRPTATPSTAKENR